MITTQLAELPPITAAEQANIVSAPRTPDAHRALLAQTPAMNAIQQGGTASASLLGSQFTVAAWNVERCLFPEDTAAHLAPVAPDIVLLSEVDHGMARTGQRHTTEVMAARLGMAYAFGVEFHELDLGGATERAYCTDDFNALGWHGNAILSSVPFERTALIRLDDHGHWFASDAKTVDPEQPRLGGRMALLAVVPTGNGPLCVASTHLESNADAAHRHVQMLRLLDAIDAFAPDLPVIIGGDLNTGNHLWPLFDWRDETLFSLAEGRGYAWDFTAPGNSTRPSLISPHPDRVMKLDWLAGRDLKSLDRGVVASTMADGRPLSDHDYVWCKAEIPD
ncbi:Metal-dependent hydrolase, endonuclease/exonuclease/phosphatase family [Yoonia tamlensis]|uniref:Metal-dependent hydrolase, endonuclease/exonuclease/phosphatase family n=1 Tax=Yoonia tamlensis TaxID=390270 RepID=A0A1I6G2I9_9RHOB|nr:endonuclease/exonuclease/phosphatase family protein [Yoonia tamlensis]SFR36399.1 Metal-dependent hydrolase, endonuclease/exonuclease/phosphatase family [Yoonia tamlensis]